MNWFRTIKGYALRELSGEIVQAAFKCAEASKSLLNFPTEKEKRENWTYVAFEFLYFFMHFTNRMAFTNLGHDKRIRLQNELAPLVVKPTIEAIFEDWPQELKDGIESEFYDKLNDAEIEYESKKLTATNPMSEDSLVGQLGRNVANLCGNPSDIETVILASSYAAEQLTAISFKDLVLAAGKEL